jgi:hypothetical protein
VQWLERCPSTVAVAEKLDSWSFQTAYRWLERQVEYKNLSVLGTVPGSNGKAQKVYGTHCKSDNLRHEVGISYLLAGFEREGWDWRRGEDVDPAFRADGDIFHYGHVFRLELDFDTERRRALEKRLGVYRNTGDFVLFVAPHERRIREVKDIGRFLGDQLLCTTIAKAAKDPFAEKIWDDIYGNKCSL